MLGSWMRWPLFKPQRSLFEGRNCWLAAKFDSSTSNRLAATWQPDTSARPMRPNASGALRTSYLGKAELRRRIQENPLDGPGSRKSTSADGSLHDQPTLR